jgi:hypothetical protein
MGVAEDWPRNGSDAAGMTWRAALGAAVSGRALRRTAVAAMIVGTTLFLVNLADAVHHGPMTWQLCTKILLTYVVPWANATFGIAIGFRDRAANRIPG